MSWHEIERIRKDAAGYRRLATSLVTIGDGLLNEWESGFLESVSRQVHVEQFSIRQAETLLVIRDGLKTVETIRGGFSVRRLIEGCHQARFDLSEADEDWIVALHSKTPDVIRINQIGRLMRCARQLFLVDSEAA